MRGVLPARFTPGWMTRDLGLLIGARLCMSVARALSGVLVPLYLALLGFSAIRLGALFALVAITSAILTAGVGLFSDRVGRKPFIIALPLLTAAAGLVFAVTRNDLLIFIFAALGSFGRGSGAGAGQVGPYQPAEQSLLADAITPLARNSLFGYVAFASSLGALIGGGPLAALPDLAMHLGLHRAGAYQPAFLVVAAFALAAALLPLPIADRRAPSAGQQARRRVSFPRRARPILYRLWLTNSVNGLAVGFFGPFITYWFYRRYGVGPGAIGALYACINIAAMFANLGAARVARRLGLVRAIVISRVLQAVLLFPMVLAPTFWSAGAIYLLRMLPQRLGLPLRQSYVMAVVPPEERGSVAGLSNLPSQGTSATSPLLAGYLFEHVSLTLPFEIAAALQALNTALFYLFFHRLHPPEEQADERARGPGGAVGDAAR